VVTYLLVPPLPAPQDLRAADADRESVVEQLRSHAAAGRLDADELEDRVGRALAARRLGELASLLADLPDAERRRPAPSPRPKPSRHRNACSAGKDPRAFVPIALLLVAIWALTGAGYFWPIWPLLWFAFAGFAHLARFGGVAPLGRARGRRVV